MDQTAFWIDNLRAALIIAVLVIIKSQMLKQNSRRIESHLRKIEKENLILHHRLEKIIRGEK